MPCEWLKHDDGTVAQDRVDLAGRASPVAVEQSHALRRQIFDGHPFAVPADCVLGCHAPTFAGTTDARDRTGGRMWTARAHVDDATATAR